MPERDRKTNSSVPYDTYTCFAGLIIMGISFENQKFRNRSLRAVSIVQS